MGLPLCSVAVKALLELVSNTMYLVAETLRVGYELAVLPLSVCFPLSLQRDLCPKWGGSAKANGACMGSWLYLATKRVLALSDALLWQVPIFVFLFPLRHIFGCESPFYPHN